MQVEAQRHEAVESHLDVVARPPAAEKELDRVQDEAAGDQACDECLRAGGGELPVRLVSPAVYRQPRERQHEDRGHQPVRRLGEMRNGVEEMPKSRAHTVIEKVRRRPVDADADDPGGDEGESGPEKHGVACRAAAALSNAGVDPADT